jgi:hypothetical protein
MAFTVNMTDQEAKSADREPLPVGKYHFKITDMDVQYTKDTAKNPNMPYFAFEFTVQDTPGPWQKFAGRKDWTNAMLFDGALYTISQILKALGYPVPEGGGSFDIPDARESYIGKDIMGRRAPDRKQMVDDGTGKMVPRIQLAGFSKYKGEQTAQGDSPNTPAGSSVLP